MKSKLNRFLLGITIIFAIFLASCNDFGEDDENLQVSKKQETTLSISVGEVSARTALPEVEAENLSKFTLTGTKSGEETPAIEKEWNLLSDMKAEKIAIKEGTYKFFLTALKKDGNTTFATYTAEVEKEITSGENKLTFNLLLQEVNVTNEAGSGTLEISITLGNSVKEQVKAITGTLLNSARNETVNATSTIDLTSLKYTAESVSAGVYVAQIDFYGDEGKKALLGTWIEAVNINSLGAKSTIKIDSLDDLYTITYKEYVLGGSIVAFSGTAPQTKYTRNSEFSFGTPSKADNTFVKWVLISDGASGSISLFAQNAVEGIARKSVGNKTYCALFVPDTEAALISSVSLSGLEEGDNEGKAKVGHTITATAKAGESDFAGSIKKWEWYYDDGSEHVIKTVSENCTATSTYIVEAKYCGKTIKARAVRNYYVAKEGGAITTLRENTEDSATASSGAEVIRGTLSATDVTVEYTETVVRGSGALNVGKFAIKSGNLKDAVNSSWSYTSSNSTITVTGSETAPSDSSENVNASITFSVKVKDGDNEIAAYEDLIVTKSVFVNVKYAAPNAESSGLPALSKDDYAIKYHHLKFTSANTAYEYSLNGTTWSDVTANEFKPSDGNITISLRFKKTGTKDNSGYIGESESYTLTTIDWDNATNLANANTGLGKKVLLGEVTLPEDPKIGLTSTATATPEISDQNWFCSDGYGSITWTWTDVKSSTKIFEETTHSLTSSYQFKHADIAAHNGNKIKVTAKFTSAKASVSNSKESSEHTLLEGPLTRVNNPELPYNGGAGVASGETLDVSKVDFSGLSYTNGAGETVTVSADKFEETCTFDPDKSGTSTHTSTLTFKLPGYERTNQTATVKVNVKAAAPSFDGGGSGGGSGGAASDNFILDDDTKSIPYGHIRFKEPTDSSNQLIRYEYSIDNGSTWLAIKKNGTDEEFPETYNKMKGDSLFVSNDTIKVRFKKSAIKQVEGGGEAYSYAYFNAGDGCWVNGDGYPMHVGNASDGAILTDDSDLAAIGFSTITEASDSVDVELDAKYVGLYKADASTITLQNDGDIELVVDAGGNAVSVKENTVYTVVAWYVDGQKVENTEQKLFVKRDYANGLKDKFVIRVEVVDSFGEYHTSTATVTVN